VDKVIAQALSQCAVYGEQEFQFSTDKGTTWFKLTIYPNGLQCWYEASEAPFEWVPISGETVIERMSSGTAA